MSLPHFPEDAEKIVEFKFDNVTNDNWTGTSATLAKTWETGEKPVGLALSGDNLSSQVLSCEQRVGQTYGQVSITIPTPVDITNAHATLILKYDETDDILSSGTNRAGNVQLLFQDKANNDFVTVTLLNKNITVQRGWVYMTFTNGQYSGQSDCDLTDIDTFYIRADHTNPWTGTLKFGYFCLHNPPAKAKIMLRLDDGRNTAPYNHFNKCMMANAYGFPVHLGIIGGISTVNSDYLSVSQLKQIRDWGHLLINHTWNIGGTAGSGGTPGWRWAVDETDGTFTDIQFKIDQIKRNADWMHREGFGKHSGIVIVPGGSDGLYDRSQLIDAGVVKCLWYTDGDANPTGNSIQSTRCQGYPRPLHSEMYAGALLDTFTGAEAVTELNDIVAVKGLETLYAHSFTDADWATLLDRIKFHVDAGDLEVLTMDDWFPDGGSIEPIPQLTYGNHGSFS